MVRLLVLSLSRGERVQVRGISVVVTSTRAEGVARLRAARCFTLEMI